MNRDFDGELADAITAFGYLIEQALPLAVDISTLVDEGLGFAEGCNKLNQLIGDQAGLIPHPVRLAMENWVDSYYSANVMATLAEDHLDEANSQAALSAYTYHVSQLQGLYMILVDWHRGAGEGPLSS